MSAFIFWAIVAGLILAFLFCATYGDDDGTFVPFSNEDRDFEK